MSAWGVTQAIVRRDLRAEWRRKDVLTTIVMFGVLTVVTFVFAFDPASMPREDIVPGTLWTAFLFSGILGLTRSTTRDAQDGGLAGQLLTPADRGAIYVGKLFSHGIFMALGEAVILVFAIVWFDLDGRHLTPEFFLILVLGSIGFVAVGTVFSVISQKSRLREVMLPVLLLPLLSPVVRAAVEGTKIIMTEESNQGLNAWLQILFGYDVIFVVAGFLLYGFVLEE